MGGEDTVTVVGVVLIVFDVLTVVGRFYSRWYTKSGFGWDDWTILIALLLSLLAGILTIYAGTVSSTGPAAASNFDPDYVFTPEDVIYTKITLPMSLLYFLVTSTTKVYIALGVVVAFWISSTVADCLNCVSLEWMWKNGNADPRYCINYNMFWLVTGIFENVIDLGILALPFGVVNSLHLDRSKKLGVIGVFILGVCVLFSGVAKVILSYQPDSREPNFSRAALWTAVHLYLGIACANLPPSWPLVHCAARLGTDSWAKLTSISAHLSRNKGTNKSQSTPTAKTWDRDGSIDVEVGSVGHELSSMNYRDTATIDDGQPYRPR
ncbi:hypothetical protein BJ166DRAFT_593174 [Pestalotiopsis sp. NC0098]|nr:hypothetical protein BJ166DRAFT_593174 [Pestalotiopsis sp. NC0098]